MQRWQQADTRAGVIALGVTLAFTWAGGTLALGAHPWWAMKVGYLGTGIGVLVWLGLRAAGLRGRVRLALAAVALLAAAVATGVGKARFAASFAEDALAGRFWFIGWIAVMAAAVAVIATLAGAILRRMA
ncbi:MAG: hypothetical protein Q8Q26_10700 [Pseudorhodobacter sp.]|nr:hypothetical protein [Pseudorhodobacter sp.]